MNFYMSIICSSMPHSLYFLCDKSERKIDTKKKIFLIIFLTKNLFFFIFFFLLFYFQQTQTVSCWFYFFIQLIYVFWLFMCTYSYRKEKAQDLGLVHIWRPSKTWIFQTPLPSLSQNFQTKNFYCLRMLPPPPT